MASPSTSKTLTGEPEEPNLSSKPIVYVLVSGGVLFYGAALKFSPNESAWIQILFSLPVMAQLIGGGLHIRNHKEENPFFYYFSMGLSDACIAVYCLLWVLYSNDLGDYRFLSAFSLVVVTALIFVIGYMMSAFMKEPDGKKLKLRKLREGAAKEPLWAMSFLFFVIFLDVTYLFGFAFAFHDRQALKETEGKAPALRMVNYDSADDIDFSAKQAKPSKDAKNLDETKAEASAANQATATPANNDDTCFYFFFNSGQARLETGPEIDYNACGLKPGPSPSPETTSPSPTPTPVEPPQRAKWLIMEWFSKDQAARQQFNRRFNRCSLERMKLRIEQGNKAGTQARVVLVGRSDNQPISERGQRPNDELLHYKSNYELSEARVQNVRYEIIEALKNKQDTGVWHNLEWLTLPSSDEDRTDPVLDNILSQQRKQESDLIELTNMNKRVVIATVVAVKDDISSLQVKRETHRKLELIDYMYFSIYTITTTGYGDIIPTTAYSKFVISIANICEVLFLVVFFNALVSIRGDKKLKQNPGANEAGNSILDLPSD